MVKNNQHIMNPFNNKAIEVMVNMKQYSDNGNDDI